MAKTFVELRKDEQILGIIRASFLARFWAFLFGLLWILLPFFFFFPLLRIGNLGIGLLLILLISGIINFFLIWKKWHDTVFLVTDLRVFDIEQVGLFRRDITELALSNMSDVLVKEGKLISRMFGLNSVRVETIKAHAFDLEIKGISDAETVKNLLLDIRYAIHTTDLPFEQVKQKQI